MTGRVADVSWTFDSVGTAGEWVSGIGALFAVGVAVWTATRDRNDRKAAEARLRASQASRVSWTHEAGSPAIVISNPTEAPIRQVSTDAVTVKGLAFVSVADDHGYPETVSRPDLAQEWSPVHVRMRRLDAGDEQEARLPIPSQVWDRDAQESLPVSKWVVDWPFHHVEFTDVNGERWRLDRDGGLSVLEFRSPRYASWRPKRELWQTVRPPAGQP